MATTKEKITDWVPTDSTTGEFKRKEAGFRSTISANPSAEFPAEASRYKLFVALACPWAHRTLIVQHLKGLQSVLPAAVVHWHLSESGWRFATPEEVAASPEMSPAPEETTGAHLLSDLYFEAAPGYTGRYTTPTLWDTQKRKIVSNESAEILRFLYTEFDALLPESQRGVTYYPEALRSQIDEFNAWVYDGINNGVYKAGFATTQEAYERAVRLVFESLDRVEEVLAASHKAGCKYIFGDKLTEADIRLYPTIVRFDPVYVQHFKCNLKMIRHDYPHIHQWMRHLYWDIPAFKETTNFEHIRKHYTKSHSQINPKGITPLGPLPDIFPKDQ